MDKHAGLAPKGSMAGNNARAAVPEGPSESLTVSGLRLVTPRSESLALFPRVAGRRNSVISGTRQACIAVVEEPQMNALRRAETFEERTSHVR
jgi:hypothetical protein